MQFLKIKNDITFSELSDRVGERNVDYILSANSLSRTPNVGKAYTNNYNNVLATNNYIDWQRKTTILNSFTQDSDIFETAALLDVAEWQVLSYTGALPYTLKIPEDIMISDGDDVVGDGVPVSNSVYEATMTSLSTPPHVVDPSIFNEYSTIPDLGNTAFSTSTSSSVFQYFNIPWGEVILYSEYYNTYVESPCYPEEVSDRRCANYTTMPDILYNYEPWQLYESSGPRSNTYEISAHRDMWSGDHSDGKANEFIRFIEAACYPIYQGAAVYTDVITLYISGKPLIRGVVSDVDTSWSGPILQDGWYAHFKISFTITEVSSTPLNNFVIRNLPLIGGY